MISSLLKPAFLLSVAVSKGECPDYLCRIASHMIYYVNYFLFPTVDLIDFTLYPRDEHLDRIDGICLILPEEGEVGNS